MQKAKFSNRILSTILAISLVCGLFPFSSVALAEETQDVSASQAGTATSDEGSASEAEGPIDLASAWANGDVTIEKGGSYYLSKDIDTEGTLVVAVPEVEEVTIDFQGHIATVKGNVIAGIDLSNSRGTINLIDSLYKDGEPSGGVVVEANKVEEAVSAVLVNPNLDYVNDNHVANSPKINVQGLKLISYLNTIEVGAKGEAHDAYGFYAAFNQGEANEDAIENAEFDITLKNVLVGSSVNNISQTDEEKAALEANYGEAVLGDDETGAAVGIYTSNKGIKIDGSFYQALNSKSGIASLYAEKDNSFTFGENFTPEEIISVYSNKNVVGATFATVEGEAEFAASLITYFESATDDKQEIAANGTALVFAAEDDEASEAKANEGIDMTSLEDEEDEVDAQNDERQTAEEAMNYIPTADSSTELVVNLNEAWTNTSAQYSFQANKWGTVNVSNYTKIKIYLTEDLEVAHKLLINASNKDFEIYLNGHSIKSNYGAGSIASESALSTNGCIGIQSAKSVKIEGGAYDASAQSFSKTSKGAISRQVKADQTGTVYSAGAAIASTAMLNGGLALSNVKLENSVEKGTQAAGFGLYSTGSTNITLDNVGIAVDSSSEQVTQHASFNNLYGIFTTSVTTLSVNNSRVSVSQNQGASSNAYGIYVLGSKASLSGVQVETSAGNNATGIYSGASATLNNIEVGANGKSEVVGVNYTNKASKATLGENVNISLSSSENASSLIELAAVASGAFELASNFSTRNSSLRVRIGSASTDYNNQGYVIATYASDFAPSEADLSKFKSLFSNAISTVPCVVSADDKGVSFVLDEDNENVYVQLQFDGDENPSKMSSLSAVWSEIIAKGTENSTVKATVTLIGNIPLSGGIDVPAMPALSADSEITIDLNGHNINYFSTEYLNQASKIKELNYDGKLLLCDNSTGEKGNIVGTVENKDNASSKSAVFLGFNANLTIDGVDILVPDTSYAQEGAKKGIIYATTPQGTYAQDKNNYKKSLTLKNMTIKGLISGSGQSYGVYLSNYVDLAMENCVLDVTNTSSGGATYGIYNNNGGTFKNVEATVKGNAAVYTVSQLQASSRPSAFDSVTLTGVSSNKSVYGVYNGFDVSFSDVSFNLEGNSSSRVINKTSTTGSLTLDKTIKITGVSALNAYVPLNIGDELVLESDKKITLSSSSNTFTNDVFASNSNSKDISGLASKFEPASDSTYSGFEAKYQGQATEEETDDNKSSLVWYAETVATIDRDGQTLKFGKLAHALAAAKSGETVKLVDDLVENTSNAGGATGTAGLTISSDISLDLNGYDYTLNMSTRTFGKALYSVNVNGKFVIEDSSENKHSFNVILEDASGSVADTGGIKYGFYVNANKSLTLNEVKCNLSYVPSDELVKSNRETSRDVCGVFLNNNTPEFHMKNSELNLKVGSVDGASYKLGSVYGVNSPSVASYDIDAESSISVVNDVKSVETGSITTNTNLDTTKYLKKVSYVEGTSEYKEIQEAFKVQAKYDEEGSNRYYALPLKLDDGSLIWAFSDECEEGVTPVASECWVQTKYTTPSNTYGIRFGASKGTIEGSITVESNDSNVAVVAQEGNVAPSMTLSNLKLSVSGGSGEFLGQSGTTSFKDIYGYRKNATGNVAQTFSLVENLESQSYCIFTNSAKSITSTSTPLLTLSGPVEFYSSREGTVDIAACSVLGINPYLFKTNVDEISYKYLGKNYKSLGVSDSDVDNALDKVFAKSSVTEADLSGLESLFAYNENIFSSFKNTEGMLQWTNASANVKFIKEGSELKNYGGDDIAIGSEISLPSATDVAHSAVANDIYTYEFVGWSQNEGTDSDSFNEADGDIPASQSTLVVTGDATYYAVYKKIESEVNITFTGLRQSDGSTAADVVISGKYGEKLGDALVRADQAKILVSQPGSYNIAGNNYVFVGWKQTSGNDSETLNQIWYPSYDMGSNFVLSSANLQFMTSGTKATFQAVYQLVGDTQHLVLFRNDGLVYFSLCENGASPTISDDVKAAERVEPFAESDKTYELVGLNKGNSSDSACIDASKVDYKLDDTLPAASSTQYFTLKFTSKQKTGQVTAYSYQKAFNAVDEVYVWSISTPKYIAVEYGKDPMQDVNKSVDPKSFVKEGTDGELYVYTFLGWSTRQNDKTPIWDKDSSLPTMSSNGLGGAGGLTSRNDGYQIYAIYKTDPLTISVNFNVADGSGTSVYATADSIDVKTSVEDAFKATGKSDPECEGYGFRGWSTTQGAQDGGLIDFASIVKTADINREIKDYSNIVVDVYAAFKQDNTYTVTFHNDSNSSDASTTYRVDVTEGKTVASTGKAPNNPSLGGFWFVGWETQTQEDDGTVTSAAFDINTQEITANTDVYATYGKISSSVDSSADGAMLDITNTFFNDANFSDCTSIEVKLSSSKSTDSNLSNLAKVPIYKNLPLKSYDIAIVATHEDGTREDVSSDFGSVKVTLPVDSDYSNNDLKLYKLNSPGKVVYDDTLAHATSGTTTAEISAFAATEDVNNITLVAIRTAEQETLYNYKATALENLNKEFNSYREVDYSPENYAILENMLSDGLNSINAATTVDDVQSVYSKAINDMRAVDTLTNNSELLYAKSKALEDLATYYSGIDTSSYSISQKNALKAAYDAAKIAVNDSKTVDDANTAYDAGYKALAQLVVEYGSGSNGNGNSGTSGTGGTGTSGGVSGTSGSGKTSLVSGLSSNTSGSGVSGLNSGSGTGATVGENDPVDEDISLSDLIDKVDGLNESDYTADSWNALQDALATAKEQLANPTSDEDQENARKALLDAYDALEYSYVSEANFVTGDSAVSASPDGVTLNGFGAWVGQHWIWFIIIPLLLILLLLGTVIYLASKRRKDNEKDDLDLDNTSGASFAG